MPIPKSLIANSEPIERGAAACGILSRWCRCKFRGGAGRNLVYGLQLQRSGAMVATSQPASGTARAV